MGNKSFIKYIKVSFRNNNSKNMDLFKQIYIKYSYQELEYNTHTHTHTYINKNTIMKSTCVMY